MSGNILEISSRASRGGKRKIEIVLHKIHTDKNETNRNGLHWTEENTLRNIESVKGIPICAEFSDVNKEIPLGHGYTETIEIDGKNTPIFENSEVCGSIDHGEIREVEINGETIKALVGIGVLYEQRYPNFVSWVRNNVKTSTIDTSVEIVGYEENDNKIIYEDGKCNDEYRTPKDYQYSGTAIISVLPADSSAIVLECATAKESNKEEQTNMTEQEIMDCVKRAIEDVNSVKESYETKLSELNSILSEKEEKISEMNSQIEDVQKALEELKREQEATWAEREALEKELGMLKAEKRLSELNEALSKYSEEEQKFAESEINSFKEAPMDGDLDVIKSKICVGIVEKQKEDAKIAEQNAANNNVKDEIIDIFGEVNSSEEEENIEDDNIF